MERIPGINEEAINELVWNAYRHGKSKRQLRKRAAAMVDALEDRPEDGIVLIYKGYIYIFSRDNALITVYKHNQIPL